MNTGSLINHTLPCRFRYQVYKLWTGNFILLVFFFFLLLRVTPLTAQSYGLKFASRDADPEKRTSLDLTPDGPLCVSEKLALSFDISFTPNERTYFGYVFRVINENKQNLDMLYDVGKNRFKIVFGDAYTDIDFAIDPLDLVNRWITLKVEIDFKKGVSLYCNNKFIKRNILAFKGNCLKICFGVSNYVDFKSTDVTPMKIRNLALTVNGAEKYAWPLNESSGNIINDSIARRKAVVMNAQWLKPRYSSWALVNSLVIKGSPSVAFDNAAEQLYITSTDSMYVFAAKTSTMLSGFLAVKHDDLLGGNQSIFNPFSRRLYNFYTDLHAVAEYNFTQHQWNRNFTGSRLTDYWHVNKFFSRQDSSLYIVAGYGHLRYKNLVQRYNMANGEWEIIKPTGDYLAPRYLSGLGTTPNGDSVYILGGYGSKDGDQLLNPKYYYDMLFYHTPSRSFKKLFTFNEPREPFVFANSLVIDADRKHYYALIYSKDQLNTQLQLIRGSLEKPEYELAGTPFPYSFFDINSFADLYYCSTTKLLLAVTMYTDKQNNTTVNIYTINSPPNRYEPADTSAVTDKGYSNYTYVAAAIGVVLLVFLGGWIARKKSLPAVSKKEDPAAKKTAGTLPAAVTSAKQVSPVPEINREDNNLPMHAGITQDARIYLFGNFEVIATNGENITKLFTPLLKELFLLLSINSIRYNKGVSPEKLIEALWNNKDTKDAINNRSVNIAKLKSILEKIDSCMLHKESGYWKLDIDNEKLYMDFSVYSRIFAETTPSNRSIHELISITQRGAFLPQTDYQWADNVKSEISNFIVDHLLKYCQLLTLPENAEKIIPVCDSIFFFDELNENALKLKCRSLIALGRHTLAKHAFEKFNVKYKEIYGEAYNGSYHSLISN